ncbi:MAG: DNA-directed RNA polymerase subunit alpha [Clostridia bacterium]|nr:DNA-directed RNA polymerase subunit alpha [Clostridia bacterium]
MTDGEINKLFGQVKIEEPNIEAKEQDSSHGTLRIFPLIRGYGTTIGNSLRRVMLSSLPGAAVVSFSLSAGGEQILHEFSTLPNVREDVTEIVMNLKGIIPCPETRMPITARLDVRGEREVRAGDLVADSGLTIVNPDHHIATLTGDADFRLEVLIDSGIGYATAESNKEKYDDGRVGVIFVDSIFSPVVNVNFQVEDARIGNRLDYDSLTMNITTDGSVSPTAAAVVAARIMKEHFLLITGLSGVADDPDIPGIVVKGEEAARIEALDMRIEDLDLSVRSYHCLKRTGIQTVLELTQKTESEMLQIKNLGKKSIDEIRNKILSLGFNFKEEE